MRAATKNTLLTAALLPFLSLINALDITSPTTSAFINPGLPLTITWVSSSLSADPASVDLSITQPSVDGSIPVTTVLGSNVPTAQGTFTAPSWSVLDWGTGFTIQVTAAGNQGSVLASVGNLTLGGGVGQVVTDASGSVVGFTTSASSAGEQGASLTGAGNPSEATAAATTPATAESATESSGTASGTGHSSSSTASSSSRTGSGSSSGAVASPTGSSSAAAAGAVVGGGGFGPKQIVASGWLGLLVAAVLA